MCLKQKSPQQILPSVVNIDHAVPTVTPVTEEARNYIRHELPHSFQQLTKPLNRRIDIPAAQIQKNPRYHHQDLPPPQPALQRKQKHFSHRQSHNRYEQN